VVRNISLITSAERYLWQPSGGQPQETTQVNKTYLAANTVVSYYMEGGNSCPWD